MQNPHKQSSFRQSCIRPARDPKRPPSSDRRCNKRNNNSATSPFRLLQGGHEHHFGRELESAAPSHRYRDAALSEEDDDNEADREDDVIEDLFCLRSDNLEELERENCRFRSMADFYDSIPDYTDLHHLSESEFYASLERLKIQQQQLMDLMGETANHDHHHRLEPVSRHSLAHLTAKRSDPPATGHKGEQQQQTDTLITGTRPVDEGEGVLVLESGAGETAEISDSNSVLSMGSSFLLPTTPGKVTGSCRRPTSSALSKAKKSVRISSGTTADYSEDFLDLEAMRGNVAMNSRSKSVSPRRRKTLTIPRPFKMTQREEEEKMMDDLANTKNYLSKISINFDESRSGSVNRLRPRSRQFKANPVPLTSRIPLYEHIKEDHRRKSALAKLNSAIELQSQVKPFKFSNDRPASSSRCLSRTASTPNLSQDHTKQQFKASPCPKSLFSNYFYNKMWEDDYFRALNRKIRAEEMLKISNLPPSMARRGQKGATENYFSDVELCHSKTHKSRKKKRKGKKSKTYEFKDRDSVPESLTNGPQSSGKRSQKLTSNSSMVSSSCETTPLPTAYPVNRPNLAATLRVQSARQKVRELAKPKNIVPETRITVLKSTSRKQAKDPWGVRKASAFRSLSYDPTNVEDIAMRLATRRAEQRLRQEEHDISMELMRQRVRAAPLLLEGSTFWGPKVGQVSHKCQSTEVSSPSPLISSSSPRRRRTPSRNSLYDHHHHHSHAKG